MKILYVTTVGSTMTFFVEHFKMLLDKGCSVELACNSDGPIRESISDLGLKVHCIPFSRSPVNKGNRSAYWELKKLIHEGNYDIVHCHTPIASAITRLVCRSMRGKGLKVFYTAHGFHFYKGAPLKNWLLYYPIEWLCAHWTDTLITINEEDYALAKKRMHAKKVEYVPGVGLNLSRFSNIMIERDAKRNELGIPTKASVFLSVGELNANKNHQIVIHALAQLKNPNVHYIIAGEGDRHETLSQLSEKLEVEEQVHLLGFRTDVAELYRIADIYVLPSIREGLNVSVMEAMAAGLPCMVSKIRGNTDLIDKNGGMLFAPDDVDDVLSALMQMLQKTDDERATLGRYNQAKILHFDIEKIKQQMAEIYRGG